MRRCLALVAILVLALSLTVGCSRKNRQERDDDDESSAHVGNSAAIESGSTITKEELAGCWRMEIPFNGFWDAMNTMAEIVEKEPESSTIALLEIFSKVKTESAVPFYLSFEVDGGGELWVDAEEAADELEAYLNDLMDYLADGGIYELREAQGVSRAEFEAQLAEKDMTMAEFVEQSRESIQLMVEGFTQAIMQKASKPKETTYAIDGKKLRINGLFSGNNENEYLKYGYDGEDTITFVVHVEHKESGKFLELPGTMTRV